MKTDNGQNQHSVVTKVLNYFHLREKPAMVEKADRLRKQASRELDKAISDMIESRRAGRNENG
jgi:cytochrome P450